MVGLELVPTNIECSGAAKFHNLILVDVVCALSHKYVDNNN